jgi:predicted N-acyltransferase
MKSTLTRGEYGWAHALSGGMRSTRTVQFALAERISHLDSAAWNELTKDASVFMRRPFLTALERALPANVAPRYALLYRGEEVLAAACLQLVRVEGRSAISSGSPLSGITQLFDERALVLGSLVGWGDTGLVMKPGADAELVWNETLRLMDKLRRFEKSEGVVNVSFVKDAAVDDDEPALRARGYQRAPSGPDMLLELDPAWGDLDGYLASLASKRRRAVKKTFEDLEATGHRVRRLSVDDLRANEARLDALYGQVWANAEVRPLRLSGRFFVELQQQLGEDCVVMGLERDGVLDGFGVCLRSGKTCVGYYLGYDKSVEAPLYLRLLVSILEQGLAWKCARVSMGRTAEEPKARLGAVPGNAALWVKHRTPPFNWAVGAILGTMEAPEVETHRVFRAG